MALVVVVNGIVLAGVRYNRSGEPDAVVELTERELRLEAPDQENSGVSLSLTLHREHEGLDRAFPWFDREKLEELGFDCRTPPEASDAGQRYHRALPRRAWVVLEYEGPAWQAWRVAAKRRLGELASKARETSDGNDPVAFEAKRLAWEISTGSRLFAIDAGSDPALLRRRHPDRRRCIITPALARIRLARDSDEGALRQPVLAGYVERLLTDSIQVPRDCRGVLASLGGSPREYYFSGKPEKFSIPRYRVTLAYGRRHEPWVAAIHHLATEQPGTDER
jgi:hypothetical protein